MKRLRCGNCGSRSMKVYVKVEGDRHVFSAIEVRCRKCPTRTRFVVPTPTIEQDNHANPDSPGSHCVY